jgi:hypothetical protein
MSIKEYRGLPSGSDWKQANIAVGQSIQSLVAVDAIMTCWKLKACFENEMEA